MDQYVQNFCRNVRYLRLSRGLTRLQMARIMGIGVDKLGRIERGEAPLRITSAMICRLCDHFNLSADTVLKTEIVP